MIRKFITKDIEHIMNIWLNSNIKAHNFIDKSYWLDNFEYVKDVLPKATIYLYEHNDKIVGFIGLNDSFIEGIFVKEEYQNKGIGSKLLNYVKNIYPCLSLHVYKNNIKATKFYLSHNFKITKEQIDESTNQLELILNYSFDTKHQKK